MLKGLTRWPGWPYVGEVARSLFGVALAILAALQWGSPAAAIAAGGGAAVAGATALQDSPHGRGPLVCGVSLGVGVAVLLGGLTSPHHPLFVLVVIAWCFAAGMLWAVSANAGLVAVTAGVLLVTCPPTTTPSQALGSALLATGGGLTQVVLVAAWPRQRWREQRDALADAYRWLVGNARHLAVDPDALIDPAPLLALRETYTPTERQARRRPPAHRGRYALPERIAMTLTVLRSDTEVPGVRNLLAAAADALAAVAAGDRTAGADARRALGKMHDSLDALEGSAAKVGVRLTAQVTEACRQSDLFRPGIITALRDARAAVMAQLHGNSPILRHAVRLAVAAGVGLAIARVTGLGEGYWMVLTVLMVLRPETAHTYTRCIFRIVGTFAGVLIASAVMVLWHPTGWAAAVLAAVFVGIAYVLSGIGYLPLSVALAAAIVVAIDIAGDATSVTLGQRLVAVLLGGVLAVASHVALPDRSLVRLRQRAGELLKAEIDYAATVIRAFVHRVDHTDETLSAMWDRTIRARSAFEATSGSQRADAPEVRRWLLSYRAALNAVTGVCVALEEQLSAAQLDGLDPQFTVAVDDYVEALRGQIPNAGQAWTVDIGRLAEADQELQDAAGLLGKHDTAQRMLVAQTETITRFLLGLRPL